MQKNNLSKWIVALAALVIGSGCSLSSSTGDSSIYVDLSALRDASRFSLLSSNGPTYGLAAPPTSATGFSCYALNVTGPGIGDSSPNPQPGLDLGLVFNQMLTRQSYCSYRGVTTRTFTLSASGPSSVALQVPPGGVRLIQVAGVNDPLVCAAGVVDDPPGSTSGDRFFEVGRAVLNDVFGDRSVDITMDWPTNTTDQALRQMDCGGGCTTVDKFAATAGSNVSPGSTISKYAQRIAYLPGKYLKRIELNLATSTVADTVTVEIWYSASAGAVPSTSTGYTASVNLPASTPLASVAFDIGTSGNYLQMQSGYDYWIVVSAATTNNVQVAQSTVAGSDMAGFNAGTSTWASISGQALDYRIRSCDN